MIIWIPRLTTTRGLPILPTPLRRRGLLFLSCPHPWELWMKWTGIIDVTKGNYAALLAFAASYGCPLAIYQCPDMAAFLASNPMANIRPFAEVPAAMIAMGHEVMDCFE